MIAHAYYNEIEPFAVGWLTNLGAAGAIAPGVVDSRSIADLNSGDVEEYSQFHTFAGIGVWSYALRTLVRWPDDEPVWTGSCPCQPFSVAGRGRGEDDPRHLWPQWRRLIEGCRPPILFGEQVASKAGRAWFSGVSADLEALGYDVAGAELPAGGVGAPHIRQRIFFGAIRVGHTNASWGRIARDAARFEASVQGQGLRNGDVGDAADGAGHAPHPWNPWRDVQWLPCADGKLRPAPLEPELYPLAPRTAGRVGRLRAYGNAIVPQAAGTFVLSFLEALS